MPNEIKVGDVVNRRRREGDGPHATHEIEGKVTVLEVREATTSGNGDKGMKCLFEYESGEKKVGDLYFKDVILAPASETPSAAAAAGTAKNYFAANCRIFDALTVLYQGDEEKLYNALVELLP